MDTEEHVAAGKLPGHRMLRPVPALREPPVREPAVREPLWRELAGQVLRTERVEHGWTLQQVAARAGVSPQYLSEVERGRKDPSSEMLETICGAVGLRLVDLLSTSGRLLHISAALISSPNARPFGVTSMAA